VSRQPRRATAQEERSAAGDADHPTVEASALSGGEISGHERHVDAAGHERIAVVSFSVAVHEHYRHRSVPTSLESVLAPLVDTEGRL
jgi:hypothetical protein